MRRARPTIAVNPRQQTRGNDRKIAVIVLALAVAFAAIPAFGEWSVANERLAWFDLADLSGARTGRALAGRDASPSNPHERG
jgi:hypothetical protein